MGYLALGLLMFLVGIDFGAWKQRQSYIKGIAYFGKIELNDRIYEVKEVEPVNA